jgi:hypothetical protein
MAGADVQFSESCEIERREIFAYACKLGLEGVVSKVRDGAYASGRGNNAAGPPLQLVLQNRKIGCAVAGGTTITPYTPDRGLSSGQLQTIVPNSLPIPAVMPSAKAPQNVTRSVARRILAPTALAPMAPSSARNPSDAADTIGQAR